MGCVRSGWAAQVGEGAPRTGEAPCASSSPAASSSRATAAQWSLRHRTVSKWYNRLDPRRLQAIRLIGCVRSYWAAQVGKGAHRTGEAPWRLVVACRLVEGALDDKRCGGRWRVRDAGCGGAGVRCAPGGWWDRVCVWARGARRGPEAAVAAASLPASLEAPASSEVETESRTPSRV